MPFDARERKEIIIVYMYIYSISVDVYGFVCVFALYIFIIYQIRDEGANALVEVLYVNMYMLYINMFTYITYFSYFIFSGFAL
jgi:hypothetical protein